MPEPQESPKTSAAASGLKVPDAAPAAATPAEAGSARDLPAGFIPSAFGLSFSLPETFPGSTVPSEAEETLTETKHAPDLPPDPSWKPGVKAHWENDLDTRIAPVTLNAASGAGRSDPSPPVTPQAPRKGSADSSRHPDARVSPHLIALDAMAGAADSRKARVLGTYLNMPAGVVLECLEADREAVEKANRFPR